MTKLYMLIGLPASGKSTWASNNGALVFSSDEYRARLLGSAENQSDNSKIFERLQHDCYEALKSGKDCIYDATNINRKDRRGFLTKVKDLPDLEKIAVVFATPLEICKERNQNRERVVPEYVYDKMLRKFEIPVEGEGFDNIKFIFIAPAVSKESEFIEKMKNFDQKNSHHTLTLGEHCTKASELVAEYNNQDVLKALKLHDVGKLYTQTLDDSGIAHYYNHENVGAYIVLSQLRLLNIKTIATLINYHMIPYTYDKMSTKKQEQIRQELADIWDLLQILHEADVAAH